MRTFARTFTGLLLLIVALTSTAAFADRDRDRGRGWGHRKHDHDRSNVSINLNVAPRPYYRDSWYRDSRHRDYRPSSGWSYGVGFGSFYGSQFFVNNWSSPYSRWDSRDRYYDRPVVVEKNIYIEHSTPTNRVTTRTISSSTTSLFRDRYGRCYERETDSFGNETRIELDPSECNF